MFRHQGTLLDPLGVTEVPDVTDDTVSVESMAEHLRKWRVGALTVRCRMATGMT